MKSKLLPALSAALIFCATTQKAQISAYTFTQSSSTYGSANTGTMVGSILQDDDINTITLPFTFTFNGTPYTSLDVCANGYMSFVTGTLTGIEYTPISTSTTQAILSPFGVDMVSVVQITGDLTLGSNTITNCSSVLGYSVGDILFDYNGDFASSPVVITGISGNNVIVSQNATNSQSGYFVLNTNGYIKSAVSGTTPNRIFELEYRNFSRYSAMDELINFKVRLYETSNKIEFLYGTIVPGSDFTPCEVGLKGNSNSDYNSRYVSTTGAWNNSAASSSISDNCDFEIGVSPAGGQSYMWQPPLCTAPSLTIAANSNSICSGQTATLTASGATNYTWTGGPATAQNTVTPSSTSVYTVMGATGSCSSSATYTLNVNSTPTVSATPSSTIVCLGETMIIAAAGATSYSLNGVAGAGSSFTVSPPAGNTTYTVTGENAGCVGTTTVLGKAVICTGIASNKELESVNVSAYPNPFNNVLSLKNSSSKEVNVSICDALGKVVLSAKLNSQAVQSVSTEHLNNGLYFMIIKTETGSSTQKLIKE